MNWVCCDLDTRHTIKNWAVRRMIVELWFTWQVYLSRRPRLYGIELIPVKFVLLSTQAIHYASHIQVCFLQMFEAAIPKNDPNLLWLQVNVSSLMVAMSVVCAGTPVPCRKLTVPWSDKIRPRTSPKSSWSRRRPGRKKHLARTGKVLWLKAPSGMSHTDLWDLFVVLYPFCHHGSGSSNINLMVSSDASNLSTLCFPPLQCLSVASGPSS